MMNYRELKEALENAKTEVQENIVAVLVQSPTPLTASEICEKMGGTASVKSIAQFLMSGEYQLGSTLSMLARGIGFKIKSKEATYTSTYVNVNNPMDKMDIQRKRKVYWVERF